MHNFIILGTNERGLNNVSLKPDVTIEPNRTELNIFEHQFTLDWVRLNSAIERNRTLTKYLIEPPLGHT